MRLSERRIEQIESLAAGWSFETKLFVLRRLRQHDPSSSLFDWLARLLRRLLRPGENEFRVLRSPELLSDWRRRFELSGSQNAAATWDRLLRRELSWHDYHYLAYLLDRQTVDIHLPRSFFELFDKLYRAHILKEYTEDPSVPRAPLVLVIGCSGSGKSAMVKQALEEAVFAGEVRPLVDLKAKRLEVLAEEPFWRSLEAVDPELAVRMEQRRKREWLRFLSRVPIFKYLLRRHISAALSSLEEEGVLVDFAMITPNDYQTAWAGEPGNYLRKAMGDPRHLSLRHLEEAHSAFGTPDTNSTAKGQQSTLIDAANIILDEIAAGRRDCLLIATTDQPEKFDPAIYRRFVERGIIMDVGEFWAEPDNLREVVRLEIKRRNRLPGAGEAGVRPIGDLEIDAAVGRLYRIFQERSLRITPAYVRRLIDSIFALKDDFRPEYLDDQFLVRDALKAVARNVFGALYNKVVGQMERSVCWEDYIGAIKNEFSEMVNNALFYNVSDEKGVVLTGPPGSGKTYMVRAWLGDNPEVQDLAVNLNDLVDPINPLEGMVENLERVYDIAKMLSPSMVFFDEGDAVAPRRSQQGGSPYDKVTNKFLSIIDGESPLSRVFTVLTTNRLDILDPALVRSKRLKVLTISGHMREYDSLQIMRKELRDIPLEPGLTFEEMLQVARSLCETPADYTAYAEKVRSLRSTEIEVLARLVQTIEAPTEDWARFVRFNSRTLLGLLEGAARDPTLTFRARQSDEELSQSLTLALPRLRRLHQAESHPATRWHLLSARAQLVANPLRKGKQQLDQFLETELSRAPQVGFVVGVGANETSGILLPIASSLVYRIYPEKIVVTGAVSSQAPGAAELDLAVQMTHQSAREALTLTENYLQALCPEINIPRLLGEFLDGYTLHHQLLSASYSVGGPSAGFALAINTLSVLLCLPVLNDFGITGAPWTKGAQPGEVGASVIIGGHRKKAEKVLQYLHRMYMPLQNYQDLDAEILESYRQAGRDIRGARSFSALVPEVFFFGTAYDQRLKEFLQRRLQTDLQGESGEDGPAQDELRRCEAVLRQLAEVEIRRRVGKVQQLVAEEGKNYRSFENLFAGAEREPA